MCILFIANQIRADYPLIIAANRDEFHARPTLPAHRWKNEPAIIAGKDQQAGGTWMGISALGYLAALTNIRGFSQSSTHTISRGQLVADYLITPSNADTFLPATQRNRQRYEGYNLLFGHWRSLGVYNNRDNQFSALTPGVHGLSNDALNVPWPKVRSGIAALTAYCEQTDNVASEDLFALLADTTPARDHELPDTGVPLAWEQRLSSIFIKSPEYGTRSSTILLVNQHGDATFIERTFDLNGRCTNQFETTISFPGQFNDVVK